VKNADESIAKQALVGEKGLKSHDLRQHVEYQKKKDELEKKQARIMTTPESAAAAEALSAEIMESRPSV
jgi:hypothetical protein